MKKINNAIVCCMLLVLSAVLISACAGVIDVRGKTFVYESVSIDWGMATDENKNTVFEEFLVSNENELLAVLKTRNNRNGRVTTFGTDSTYTTVNKDNEILDAGYYKQDDDIITLAESQETLSNAGNYTLKANDKGYKVSDEINSEFSVFAVYQYVVND